MKPTLRRARAPDYPTLINLIEAFYQIDQHPFELKRIERALPPLLASDAFGVVYLIESDTDRDTSTQSSGPYSGPSNGPSSSPSNGPFSDPSSSHPNAPMGYTILTWGYSLESGGREALIDEIFLRQRNMGIGTQVMPLLLEALRAQGIVKIFLETETHNTRARRFYARSGFIADDSIWMSRPL